MTRWMIAATALAYIATAALPQMAQAQAPADQGANARPWMNKALSAEKRAELLLAAMTQDEKIAILHGPMAMPLSPQMPMPKGAVGSAGYIPGNERLGIPAQQESDASLGVANPVKIRGADDYSTALPSGLLLAATFNPAIAHEGGVMIGTEARSKGLNVMLAGGVNLARDPRNGRNFEYVGEDPLLAGIMAGESIKGIQSTGMVSTVKHFALNDQEHLRMTADSVIGEAAARESDLLAFQIAIERGKPGSVMCSYNTINGAYGCDNDWLLNTVLKKDWGYKGYVMSDWGAVHRVDAALNGLDQQSGEQLDKQIWFDKPLREALAAGKITQARIDDMARRVLFGMFDNGLFDNPPVKAKVDFAAHAQVAQREAEEGIVLLRNEGVLPLAATAQKIAVIGGYANAGVPSGTGSSQVTTPWMQGGAPTTVPLGGEGMMAAFSSVVYHPSAPLNAIRERMKGKTVGFDPGFYPEQAAEKAKGAEIAIVFVNQPQGEGQDVPNLSLPNGQDALIEAVAAANPNTIVVLQTGGPVRMPWLNKVKGVVQAWYSGQKGGEAIARVLFGEVNPSGRLPMSWAVDESQLPRPVIPGWGQAEGSVAKVDYTIEGSDVGYRWYARQKTNPLYWFGHGLSYTSFAYANLAVTAGTTLSASVDVTNSGARAGSDVVQLYLTGRPGGPARRLIAFQKVSLAPGETRKVTLTADPRLLADFDETGHGWKIDAGAYSVGIGTDAGTIALTQQTRLKAQKLKP
ncbi:MAG: glycoside hydrolase family 3 C-terminal domain-containing protein [Sphingobium sp.]|nr:glycoside hydrolase family 3 C-terminal domain-containing protein [Sphingobium sp.]